MTVLQGSVRDYLRVELGDAYTYYDTDDSISDIVSEREGTCGIIIYPGGDAADGSVLLHGEGIVLFDRETLVPKKFLTFAW